MSAFASSRATYNTALNKPKPNIAQLKSGVMKPPTSIMAKSKGQKVLQLNLDTKNIKNLKLAPNIKLAKPSLDNPKAQKA